MENRDLNCSAEALFLNACKIVKPFGIYYVGAYEGDGLKLFKDCHCPVYAFEPNPYHWPKIESKFKEHNVQGALMTCGIGNFDGELDLNIPDRDQIASSFLPTKTITSLFPHMSLKQAVKSKITTIDNFSLTGRLKPCNYLILDIQGLEFNALLGAYNTILKDVDVIITEYSTHELYSSQNLVGDLNALLKELGFFTKSNLSHVHADAIYLKEKWRHACNFLPNITHPIISQEGAGFTTHDFGYNHEWGV